MAFHRRIPRYTKVFLSAALAFGLAMPAQASRADRAPADAARSDKSSDESELERLRREKEVIEARMSLELARREEKLAAVRAQIADLKAAADLMAARRERESEVLRRETAEIEARNARLEAEREQLSNQLAIAKAKLALELQQANQQLEVAEAKRELHAKVDTEIPYRKNPVVDGVLEITDRRIALNGPITMRTADEVTERLNFYNNKSAEYPIFIVIDHSPGGSVMAGYRIVEAMEASAAPVHVLVKSFAASMAAVIATLADHSYAYPNAVLLHHQLSSGTRGNLTQQREHVQRSEEWSRRLLGPVCEKLGITEEQFVQQMYKNDSGGDWAEFGDRAAQLNWINQVVHSVRERGVVDLASTDKKGLQQPQPQRRKGRRQRGTLRRAASARAIRSLVPLQPGRLLSVGRLHGHRYHPRLHTLRPDRTD